MKPLPITLGPPEKGARGLGSGAVLLLVALFLVGLRGVVFASDGMGFSVKDLLANWRTNPVGAVGLVQLFLSSLCFELLSLLLLCRLTRSGMAARWLARGGLLALLWLNLAGTQVFMVINTYAKGFQLSGLSLPELGRMMGGYLEPKMLAALGLPVLVALFFGREGSVERQRPPLRMRVLLLLLMLAAGGAVYRLVRYPLAVPAVAHSPLTLLVVNTLPEQLGQVPHGRPAPEDWAPSTRLETRWQPLGGVPRDFNVVVVVLESVRASVFWPSPDAPPMPHLAELAPHAAVFTRAYAHEPLSTKGLESLLFGIYPSPYWETAGGKFPDIPLDSVGERWTALGLRNAFISHNEVPFMGEAGFLTRRGFSYYSTPKDMAELDSPITDRTLVKALDRFIEGAPGKRFGAILWPHHTHLPYQFPKPMENAHPPNSFAAYRDAVAYQDLVIGDLVEMLKRRGQFENTVLVLVADHGEAFREHPEAGSAHGDRLFDMSVHIPLVFINPRLFHGERDDRVVQQKDVAATLAWLAGDSRPVLNLGSTVFHEHPSQTAYLISHLDVASMRGALVQGRLKYMYVAPLGTKVADERLYDLVADPGERHDLWQERQEEGRALKARYFGWLQYWSERWGSAEHSGAVKDREALYRELLGGAPPQVASPAAE
ncbi:sulfatase-like hydrolase/transferase [Hyalangium versicolor]|uniref:sulfatase-like hydrolase/transferase n=1 Tax=Hyalangium versicolor TaxID=2861190 RepID=UPI001CCBA210|nr:sulfatase-like hydrolase/transferase [Hyalangium versicolor]